MNATEKPRIGIYADEYLRIDLRGVSQASAVGLPVYIGIVRHASGARIDLSGRPPHRFVRREWYIDAQTCENEPRTETEHRASSNEGCPWTAVPGFVSGLSG